MIPFAIDSLTPCLKNVQTGDIIETEVIRVNMEVYKYEWSDDEL